VWVEDCEGDGHWYLMYSKWHPLYKNGHPIIVERAIQPRGYIAPDQPPDPELSITHDNELYMIYSSRTRGYTGDGVQPFNRVFFVKLDVNGVIQTTNTYISTNSNTDVINSASDINTYEELMCVWDIFDPAANGGLGQWSDTIQWRNYVWKDS